MLTKEEWEYERKWSRIMAFIGLGITALAFVLMLLGKITNSFEAIIILVALMYGPFMMGYGLLPGKVGKVYENATGKKW